MSDQSQGPGWWIASDGKWYPPEVAPPTLQPPPPPQSPGPGWWLASDGKFYPPAAPSGPSPYAGPPTVPSPPMNGCLKAFLIGVAVLVGLVVLAAILAPADEDPEQSAIPKAPDTSALDDAVRTERADGSVVLVSCNVTEYGTMAAQLQVTNNSSDRSNYLIKVAFYSADGGDRLGTAYEHVSGLEAGQTVSQEASGARIPPRAGYVCEVQDVTRSSDE